MAGHYKSRSTYDTGRQRPDFSLTPIFSLDDGTFWATIWTNRGKQTNPKRAGRSEETTQDENSTSTSSR